MAGDDDSCMREPLWKAIQRRMLDTVSTPRRAVTAIIVATMVIVFLVPLSMYAGLQVGELRMAREMRRYAATFNVFSDNIAHESYQDRMCSSLPIDIVYTWVNGSDPKLKAELDRVVKEIEERERIEAELEEQRKMEEIKNATRNSSPASESDASSASSPSTEATTPPGTESTRLKLIDHHSLVLSGFHRCNITRIKRMEALNRTLSSRCGSSLNDIILDPFDAVALVEFADSKHATTCLEKGQFRLGNRNVTVEQALFVGNSSADGIVKFDPAMGLDNPCLGSSSSTPSASAVASQGSDVSECTPPHAFSVPLFSAVMVDNLPRDMGADTLKDIMGQFGNITRVTMSRRKKVAIVVFERRWSQLDALERKRVGIHRDAKTHAWLAAHLPVNFPNTSSTTTAASSDAEGAAPLGAAENDAPSEALDGKLVDRYHQGKRDAAVASVSGSQAGKSTDVPEQGKASQSSSASQHKVLEDNDADDRKFPLATTAKERQALESQARLNASLNHDLIILPGVRIGLATALDARYIERIASGDVSAADEEEDLEDVPESTSMSRFQDNSELQYSLRSVEKHAPWVRHIFIVTNGQIPDWLDLDHPRISVVTHEDIFVNKSHLPTFSSPAIETHLHRIPGLSRYFIYLNDDVMFGTDIWPDDFYSHSRGQKVVLAWPVPNCAESCPSNWIGDNYCDAACNNEECDFDGGDCVNKDQNQGQSGGSGWHAGPVTYCAESCADSWLGDRFCDHACNVIECGYDAGDCGAPKIEQDIPKLEWRPNSTMHQDTIVVDGKRPRSVYFDLTDLIDGGAEIVEGSFTNFDAVAAAVINVQNKMLTVVLRADKNCTYTVLTMAYEKEVAEIPATGASHERAGGNATQALPNQQPSPGDALDDGNDAEQPADQHNSQSSSTPAGQGGKQDTQSSSTPVKMVKRKFVEYVNLTICTNEIKTTTVNRTTLAPKSDASEGIKLVNGSSINAWDVDDLAQQDDAARAGNGTDGVRDLPSPNTTTTTTTTTTKPKSKWYSVPSVDRDSLPSTVRSRIAELEDELNAGELTDKGFAKYMHFLLLPFANETATDRHNEEDDAEGIPGEAKAAASDIEPDADDGPQLDDEGLQRRHLLSLDMKQPSMAPLFSPFKRDAVESLGGVVRMGARQLPYPIQQVQFADWMSNQKHKQLNLKAELASRISVWEQKTGLNYKRDIDDYRAMMRQTQRNQFPYNLQHDYETSAMQSSGPRRTLKDTFGDSLKFVNHLYNKRFGYEARKVIAHMPHFLDRTILEELENTFPREWNATSSHQLRSPKDMQYAFAYYYFLMSQREPFNATEEFRKLDTDENGILGVHELRTLIARVFPIPTSAEDWELFEDILLNCSSLQPPLEQLGVAVGPDAKEVWVTEQLFANCTKLVKLLNDSIGVRKKYKYETETDDVNVAFKMIHNNASKTSQQLDDIRRSPKKFICLNDNIDHRKKSAEETVAVLRSFYESLFPLRSQFELPIGYRNRFLYMSELREHQATHERYLNVIRFVLVVLIGLLLCMLFGPRTPIWLLRLTRRLRGQGGRGSGAGGSSSTRSEQRRELEGVGSEATSGKENKGDEHSKQS